MWEYNLSITEVICSFVHDQYRNKVYQEDDGMLILVDLTTFDLDELIGHVLFDMKHDLILEHMLDHLIILGFQKLQDIISCNVEIRII